MADRGRPTKYTPDLCDKLIKYFKSFEPFRQYEYYDYDNDGNRVPKVKLMCNKLPSVTDFAMQNGISRSSIVENWIKEYPDFFDAYQLCLNIRRDLIIQQGNSGLVPPGSFTFIASNLTDMRSVTKIEQENRYPEGKPDVTINVGDDEFIQFIKQKNKKNKVEDDDL